MQISDIQKGIVWPFPETDDPHALMHFFIHAGRMTDIVHENTHAEDHGRQLDKKQLGYSLATMIVSCCRVANLNGVDLDEYIPAAVERHKPRGT